MEPWGSWSSKRRAQLRLNLGAEHAGQEASLYLELRLPPYDADQQVWVSNSVGNSVALTSLGAPRWVRCKVAVDDDGFLNIYIERHLRETEVGNGDARRLYVGLSGLGYYLNNDLAARTSLIENLILLNSAISDRGK